ncbi:hypothetical protein F4780DRAFT_779908 [Xylariomycetidae sp. FL0641]|nr:hypothetical protein F4780DRAFT_779908 [Xylariomycetidae sp. FL0641]
MTGSSSSSSSSFSSSSLTSPTSMSGSSSTATPSSSLISSTTGISSGTTSTTGSPTSSSSSSSSASTASSSSTTTTTSSGAPAQCTTTPADTGLVANGDFETGLSPWSVDLVDLFTTSYRNGTPPGAEGSCSAFAVAMAHNPRTEDFVANLRLTSELLSLPPQQQQPGGGRWNVSFWVMFDRRNAAFLDVAANLVAVRTVRARDVRPRTWTRFVVPFLAQDTLLQLQFSFLLANAPENTISVDRVAVRPAAAALEGP